MNLLTAEPGNQPFVGDQKKEVKKKGTNICKHLEVMVKYNCEKRTEKDDFTRAVHTSHQMYSDMKVNIFCF